MKKNCYLVAPYIQKRRNFYSVKEGLPSDTVKSLCVDKNGVVWIGTDKGLSYLKDGKIFNLDKFKKTYCEKVFCDTDNNVYLISGNCIFMIKGNKLAEKFEFENNVKDIAEGKDKILWTVTTDGLFRMTDGKWVAVMREELASSEEMKISLTADFGEKVYLGCNGGIFALRGKRYRLAPLRFDGRCGLLSPDVRAVKYDNWGHIWYGTDKGVGIYDDKSCWLDGENTCGLPKMSITCIEFDKKGGKYFGTDRGLILLKNGERHFFGPRIWIPDFYVNDVAVNDNADKVYVATNKGIAEIISEEMTLGKKAEIFADKCEKLFKRRDYCMGRTLTEYENIESGYVEISDNDGLWTANYLAYLCFRYGVTGEKDVLEKAQKSLKAIIKLADITGIPGFTARAIRYKGEKGFGDGDPEWHLTPDGKCEWKGETSSDEMTGHFFVYPIYYDLCANDKEKKEIARVCSGIIDHILANNYRLCDCDGLPTTWACWDPDKLNNDNKWAWEKGVNSLEILAFLKATYHVTGDEKYNEEYKKLIREHHYALNTISHKQHDYHTCHIDDNLGFLATTTLLRLEEDEDIKSIYLMGLKNFFQYERVEKNAFWSFVYYLFSDNVSDIDSAVETLKQINMSPVNYSFDVSGRDDIVIDERPLEIGERPQLLNTIPYCEHNNVGLDSNIFNISYAGGFSSSFPVMYLLPYWFGRYYGLIGE